jgi:hypothetical protein
VKIWPGDTPFSADIIGSTTGSGTTIWNPSSYTRVTGIVFQSGSTGNNRIALIPTEGFAYNCKYIQNDGCATLCVWTSSNATMINCYVELNDVGTGGENGISASSAGINSTIDSCTVVRKGGTTGIAFNGRHSGAIYRNCVAYGSWTTEWGSTNPSATSANNAGEIAAASQPTEINDGSYIQITSDPFENSSASANSGDYHPAADGQLDGAGVTVSGITEDAEGTTKADPPSIGFLEPLPSAIDYPITIPTGPLR